MRFYKVLLYLYPAAFRSEYAEEICHVFEERRRTASGPLSFVWLWLAAVGDVLRSALYVHADVLGQDLRYALRTLVRAPCFALTAILVTALGIGANTAVFSITDHVLIRPLPFPDSERLVKLWENVPGYTRMELSPPNYRDWKRMSTSFEGAAAYVEQAVNLAGVGQPERLEGVAVGADLFPLLGVAPVTGRTFVSDDDREGAPGTLLLSYGFWKSLFGGDRDVVGKRVRLDDESYVILGIMPEGFHFPTRGAEFWMPMRLGEGDFDDRDNNYLKVLAKLKRGVSIDQARAEMQVITEQLERAYPKENERTRATVLSLRNEVSQQARLLLGALFGASACLLLITCSNLASLFLARALGRRKESAVRMAIGARRERLVRQLLTESLVLAFLGGVLGVFIAVASVPLLARLVPASLPMGEATAASYRVFAFAALVTLLTGIGFGVVPALRVSNKPDSGGLREGSRAGVGGRRERLRAALVVAEVTISVVLLISSGLLIRALSRIQAVDPGFRTEGVLTLRTAMPTAKYGSTARRAALYSRILSDVRALPGVTHAAYVSGLPMVMRGGIWPVEGPDIQRIPEIGSHRAASLRFVTPGFFGALSIPIRLGRDVSDSDTREAPFVAVVSESFVRRYWPEGDPLGRRFRFAFADRTVAGVVADIRVRGLEGESEPQVYLPYQQVEDGALVYYAPKDLIIRGSSETEPLVAAVRGIVQKADPELPISNVRSLADVVDSETAPRRTQVRVLGAFAGISLLLAGIGLHGLLSFAVSQRIPEIGLRIALGARAGDVLSMVLRQGVVLAGMGSALGLVLAYAAGRTLSSLLAGVEPGDPVTFLSAGALALLMVVSGSLLPALRAVRVDPTTAIRAE